MSVAMRLGVLRIVLNGAPFVLALVADEGCVGAKVGGATGFTMTAVSNTVNVNLNGAAAGAAEGAAQSIDPAAGQKGTTEYEGVMRDCKFVEKDGKRVSVECK